MLWISIEHSFKSFYKRQNQILYIYIYVFNFATFISIGSFAEDAENSCKVYCEKAIKQDPDNPDAYQVMANFLLSEQKNEVT